MSDFKAKMHNIRFPTRLRHRPRWESLQCSPNVFKGLLLRRRGKREERGRGRKRESS